MAHRGIVTGGRALESRVRAEMESHLGHDFSGVRIHTEGPDQVWADALGARAFTVGHDVFFGAHDYAPHTETGGRLLVHELTHTMQQDSSGGFPTGVEVGRSDDPAEHEAEAVARSGPVAVPFRATPAARMVRRQPLAPSPATVDYDDVSFPDGMLKDGDAAHRLCRNPEQLDQVYADAGRGMVRAQRFTRELEDVYGDVGTAVAEKSYSLWCQLPVVHELGGCIPNWNKFDYLRKDSPGGQRLLTVVGRAYESRSKELGLRNKIIQHALNLLYAGMVVRGAMVRAPSVSPADAEAVATRPRSGVTTTAVPGPGLPGPSADPAPALTGPEPLPVVPGGHRGGARAASGPAMRMAPEAVPTAGGGVGVRPRPAVRPGPVGPPPTRPPVRPLGQSAEALTPEQFAEAEQAAAKLAAAERAAAARSALIRPTGESAQALTPSQFAAAGKAASPVSPGAGAISDPMTAPGRVGDDLSLPPAVAPLLQHLPGAGKRESIGEAPQPEGSPVAEPEQDRLSLVLASRSPMMNKRARFGSSPSGDYTETFFRAYPELRGKVVVHHAVPQKIQRRFSTLISIAEIHSLENLRGIPKNENGWMHLSMINTAWNGFLRDVSPKTTREDILDYATKVDDMLGAFFLPPVRSK